MVGVMGPKIPCDEIAVRHIGQGKYTVNYRPSERGNHVLMVKWGDKHIPGSPFHIVVHWEPFRATSYDRLATFGGVETA